MVKQWVVVENGEEPKDIDPASQVNLDVINLNQYDGCRRGLPVVDGLHRGEGYDLMASDTNARWLNW